jgi:hypothetical protein
MAMRGASVWLLALAIVGCHCCSAASGQPGEKLVNESNEIMIPDVTIEAEARYVLEFPILIAIKLRNDTVDTNYLDLPELGIVNPLESVGVELQPVDGGAAIRLKPSFDYREQGLFRTQLMAGARTRMLIDLCQFGQSFSAGQYRLTVSIFESSNVFRSSPAVNVSFVQPTAAERTEAARLRRMGLSANTVDSGSWQPFLTHNWNTVVVAPAVGPRAMRQLGLYLTLHRAAYGPESLAQMPTNTFEPLSGDLLSAEAALLDYEIVVAHGDRSEIEKTRARALHAWPDLKLRLNAVDKGEGLVRILRTGYGAERPRPLPGPRPYTAPHPN